MSGSGRGKRFKIGLIVGIIAAILIAAAFIGWGLWKSAEYERQAYNETTEYAAYTDKKVWESCLNSAVSDEKQCVAEARQEQRANERDEYDLVAQRQSALWAYIMGAAAVIGMGLSVIGVILVYTTFDETRRSNEIAQDAAKAAAQDAALSRLALVQAERAIVHVLTAGQYPTHDYRPDRIEILFTVKNLGRSNAHDFTIYFNASDKLEFKTPFAHHRVFNKICVPITAMEFDKIPIRKPKSYPWYVVGYLEYSTLANAVFKSFFAFEISGPFEDDGYSGPINTALTAVYCESLPTNT